MNLLIFGATGATGTHLVSQALDRGHMVTAFVRDPLRLARVHSSLRHVVGDVMNQPSVDSAMQGQDAVLCVIGTMPEVKADRSRRQRGAPVCSVGTKHIILAMTHHAVRRLVVETSAGVGSSRKDGKFGAGTVIRFFLRDVMEDKEHQEISVRESTLDWTIFRPVKLSNAAASGRHRGGDRLRWGLTSKISRSDVAAIMLESITEPKTFRRAITLLS